MTENFRETIEKDQAILSDPDASMDETRKAQFDLIVDRRGMTPLDVIATYLAKFCGSSGYVEQEKDPILSDFLADLYCKGCEMAVAMLVGPEASQDQKGEAMDTVKDRIRDFIKTDED